MRDRALNLPHRPNLPQLSNLPNLSHSARRLSHDGEPYSTQTYDPKLDADGVGIEEGVLRTVRRQYRRRKNNEITGRLVLVNSSLIGVDLYLGGCAIETSEIYVFSHISVQSNKVAKYKALESNASYYKAFKINEKEACLFIDLAKWRSHK